MQLAVQIQIQPNEVMVDEKFNIRVSGLKSHENITINARVHNKDKVFTSLGCFQANNLGIVDCAEHPSQAGTYTGVHCMGLVWSMIQAPGQKVRLRLLKTDVCSPQVIHFVVYKEHLSLDDVFSKNKAHVAVATADVTRWYKSKDVRRVPLRQGKLRGTVFIPPGRGPFPGILDLYGGSGGLIEIRAALLASHGFVVLALAYFDYDDIDAERIYWMDINYFKDAVKYLKSHPHTQGRDIGAIGVSKGGEIVQLLATRCPEFWGSQLVDKETDLSDVMSFVQLKAVTSINGVPYSYVTTYEEDGSIIKPAATYQPLRMTYTEEGLLLKTGFPIDSSNFFPVWNAEANILSICGSDDQNLPVELQWLQYDKWPVDKKHKVEFVCYEGAGHLIEPPYAPFTRASYWKTIGVDVVWGGNALDHSFAQDDSWKRILEFFNKNLKEKHNSNFQEKSRL